MEQKPLEPRMDDIGDDLQSMCFNSTTTTTAKDIHRSTGYALKPPLGPLPLPTTSTLPLLSSNLTPPTLHLMNHVGTPSFVSTAYPSPIFALSTASTLAISDPST
ncbi:unnamed protein product [Fraxinus pennsylvanica]|uniref:Uncharacterized protein n=1 Tax=Fraxinus pennsylvanica TaxID=56036 RepID=A0AAD2A9K3_9LAMI|nr:unnamed protein product [Fraxinus pennsylvanica]